MKETIIGKEDREKFFEEPLYKKSLEQRVEHIMYLWEQYNEYDEYDMKIRKEMSGYSNDEDSETYTEMEEEIYDIGDVMNDIYGEMKKVLQMN